jgi:hypothetical protein
VLPGQELTIATWAADDQGRLPFAVDTDGGRVIGGGLARFAI